MVPTLTGEYCNITSRFQPFVCGILALVYKRNIPPIMIRGDIVSVECRGCVVY